MELALTIIAVLGFLIFIISYLRFVFAGFSHHPVTGAIAAVPVLNVLVLPTLWYRTGKFLVFGLFALLVAVGSWFMGAEKGLNKYSGMLLGKNLPVFSQGQEATSPTTTSTLPIIPNRTQAHSNTSSAPKNTSATTQSAAPQNTPPAPKIATNPAPVEIDESKLERLPSKALYKMAFEEVSVINISTLQGRIVRLLDKDFKTLEGRVGKVSASSVFIQTSGNQQAEIELPISNIKKLSLMVKKPL